MAYPYLGRPERRKRDEGVKPERIRVKTSKQGKRSRLLTGRLDSERDLPVSSLTHGSRSDRLVFKLQVLPQRGAPEIRERSVRRMSPQEDVVAGERKRPEMFRSPWLIRICSVQFRVARAGKRKAQSMPKDSKLKKARAAKLLKSLGNIGTQSKRVWDEVSPKKLKKWLSPRKKHKENDP
ncbi:hypothetical protein B0H16DRAFT_1463435 [Mycena metata]|uniref:Uncharacterized protein n=1 Tax=Mycena metata TaxID=1033252 RepID=A0AAD7IJM5_9AGAR|nr:hypothetical protein B0H16DRAFT_1463435 [Mycena metata]